MGTTTDHSLPYPEGTDLVIAGDDAIQELAEATAAALNPEMWVYTNPLTQALTANVTAQLVFNTGIGGSGDFHASGGEIIYDGPTGRMFLITAVMTLAVNGASDTAQGRAELQWNGVMNVQTTQYGSHQGHSLTTLIPLSSGDGVSLAAWCNQPENNGGAVSEARLFIASLW